MSQLTLYPESEEKRPAPILKWAGGKGKLLRQFTPYFPPPSSYYRYFEPFLGGGAVFFHLLPRESFLFDLNPELIGVYEVVRDHVEELIASLGRHQNSVDYFYQIRSIDPSNLNKIESASRFIYLNKTCYNGLYRVNSDGAFNVPFGRYKNPTIRDVAGLHSASKALQTATLMVSDFGIVADYAKSGDLIYFDPPYVPLSATSNFTNYTSKGFTSDDQKRLASLYRDLDERGCLLMLSNSDTTLIREIYRGFNLNNISARRAINSNPNGRGHLNELLITNF